MKTISVTTIVFSFVLGTALGLSQYWSEITQVTGRKNPPQTTTTIDAKVLQTMPNLDQIMALDIPKPGESPEVWEEFLISLEGLQLGERQYAWSHTSPLQAFYAYTAKHQPETIYKRMSDHATGYSLINNLLQLGFLPDWYTQVNNVDEWLLSNRGAVKSVAAQEGIAKAQQMTANAFLSAPSRNIRVDLVHLRFASHALSDSQLDSVLQRLLNGDFKYDPRRVESLIGLRNIKDSVLVQLIKNQAYSSKSMSSYMTTATRLGDKEYVYTLARDVATNDGQPTNFYCSACALSLHTDGLIGNPLVRAVLRDEISVNYINDQLIIQSNDGILSSGALQ